jgi:hypothetical protein
VGNESGRNRLGCSRCSTSAALAAPAAEQVIAQSREIIAAVLNVSKMSLPETGREAYGVVFQTASGQYKTQVVEVRVQVSSRAKLCWLPRPKRGEGTTVGLDAASTKP